MFQQESIYSLVPKEKIIPGREKRYKSYYPPTLAPTATTFILNNTSYPNVANMNGENMLPRGAHSTRGGWRTFGLPEGAYRQDPQNFYKKGHQYKTLPPPEKGRSESEIKRPPIPSLRDRPVMGLKTDKNYITANAVDVILMQPKKRAKEEMDYLNKKYYGQVPRYLKKIKTNMEEEYRSIREMQKRTEEEEARKKRVLTDVEVQTLREGLLKKLEKLKLSYGQLTHKKFYDTLVCKNKKEGLEKEMEIIEKDLESLNHKTVIVDFTK